MTHHGARCTPCSRQSVPGTRRHAGPVAARQEHATTRAPLAVKPTKQPSGGACLHRASASCRLRCSAAPQHPPNEPILVDRRSRLCALAPLGNLCTKKDRGGGGRRRAASTDAEVRRGSDGSAAVVRCHRRPTLAHAHTKAAHGGPEAKQAWDGQRGRARTSVQNSLTFSSTMLQ